MFACTLNTNAEHGEATSRVSPEASARDDGAGVHEDADIEIGAADPLRLDHAEQAGPVEVALRLVGETALLLAVRRALGDDGLECARPVEHLRAGHAAERYRL